MNTKAQATVFVIIGITMLIAVVIFFGIRTGIITQEAATEQELAQKTPSELLPIRSFVDSCITNVAKEGINTVSQHGGYATTERLRSNPAFPTDNANALDILPPNNLLIPYWYYMESGNDCKQGCSFKSEMPELCKRGRNCVTSGPNSIEAQLESYVNAELEACLNDFKSFVEQGFLVTPTDRVRTETLVRDNDVQIRVAYPVTVKHDNLEADMNEFVVTVQSDLAELYTMAKDIRDYEMDTCFLEKQSFDYLSQFMGMESSQLPPISKTEIGSFSSKIWLLQSVKNNVKQKTSSAIKLIGVFNQSGFAWPTAQPGRYQYLSQGLLDQNVFYPLKEFHDASVSLDYLPIFWEPYLAISPHEGQILTASTELKGPGGPLGSLFSFITQTKRYQFSYDYSFPVMIEIRKPLQGEQAEEQLFRFALESNIRANDCFKPDATVTHLSTSISESLLCDDAQKTKQIRLHVVNASDNNPVEGIDVSFTAGETCPLGTTDSSGNIAAKYPPVFGEGQAFVLEKPGYATKYVKIPAAGNDAAVSIEPILEKNVAFKIISPDAIPALKSATNPQEGKQARNAKISDPLADHLITLYLTRVKENSLDPDFNKFIVYEKGAFTPEKLELIPGRYNVSITSMLDREITIPAKTIVVEGQSVPLEEQKLEPVPNGGADFTWDISTYSQLLSNDEIVFFVFGENIPSTQEDMISGSLTEYTEWSKTLGYALQPELR